MIIIVIIVVGITLGLQNVSQPSALEVKVNELSGKGYNTQYSTMTFNEFKAERIGEGGAFEETYSWSIFLQQVQTTKQNLGFVTVWVCEEQDTLWIHATEQTYYYYGVSSG